MRHSIKSLIISLSLVLTIFIGSISMVGCSTPQIDRAISIASTVPGIIASLHLSGEAEALKLINEGIADFKIFRDNPTRGNFQNAMAAIDHMLASDVFHINGLLLGVIQALRVTFAAIVPVGNMSGPLDEKISVKDVKVSDVDKLEQAVKALKAEAKK